MSRIDAIDAGEAMMSEAVSYRYENKEYLLNTIMNQLGMTEEDLEQDPSWVRAKVRESNIDKVLDTQN
jgi:ribosome assembly protein YihI (activator of Der GTPase)